MEDLALHDAAADMRAPTHALTRCHAILRRRRRISARSPGWALHPDPLASLRGVPHAEPAAEPIKPPDDPIAAEEAAFAAELSALGAVMARSRRTLAGYSPQQPSDATPDPVVDALIAKPGAEDAFDDWLSLCQRTRGAPTQAAAVSGAVAQHDGEQPHDPRRARLNGDGPA